MNRRVNSWLKRFTREESGAYAVEFAMISTAFFTLIFGSAYLGIMMWYRSTLQWAVEKGIRMAAISKTTTQSQVTTAINGYLNSVNLPNATVSFDTAAYNGIQVSTVTASYTKSVTMPFVSTFNLTYSSTAKMPQIPN
jgi:Flp pilus assembly protein TadG